MHSRRAAVLGVLVTVGLAPVAPAEIVSFTVDPTRSTLALSGAVRYYFNGSVFGYVPQSEGSMSASYAGSIAADLNGDALTFSGGSMIVAQANPAGPFQPAGPGSVDVYGMQTFANGGAQAFNRMYDLEIDFTSGVVSNGMPFTGNVSYTGASGGIFPFFDPAPRSLAGVTAANAPNAPVTLESDGTTQTLTVPVNTTLILFGNGTGVETQLTGSIVATRTIPAPGAGVLLFASGMLLGRRRSR